MVLVHKWDLLHVFIFGKIGKKKKSLCRYCRKKKRLSRLYNQGVKKKKRNWPFFQRGLVHGFAQKMTFFPRFYLWQNTHWNKKNAFLGYKNKKFKQSKN